VAIRFLKLAEPYGCFSNFSRYPIYVGLVWYKTTEHYYQSQKFEDIEYKARVIDASSPKIAADLGRTLPYDMNRWDRIKNEIMYNALVYKVQQNEEVKNILLSTGDEEIIECSKRDSYWADGPDGKGLNMLGKTWMKVREDLRRGIL
jgi:N-glycosidase YbiA